MTTLSVNVNKIAVLRNSRGKNMPDLVAVSKDIEYYGAQGITVHPRPDARHIRFQDVHDLKKNIKVELNVEGYPSEPFLKMIEDVKPAQCTLVPDPPEAITSSAGWKVAPNRALLKNVAERLRKAGVRSSVFVDPNISEQDLVELHAMGVDRIELYTELYAENFGKPRQVEVTALYAGTAAHAYDVGLGINAGHDLNLHNLAFFRESVPHLEEVSIGHALICDALYFGLEKTIEKYLSCLVDEH